MNGSILAGAWLFFSVVSGANDDGRPAKLQVRTKWSVQGVLKWINEAERISADGRAIRPFW